jgi:hypothetical protein
MENQNNWALVGIGKYATLNLVGFESPEEVLQYSKRLKVNVDYVVRELPSKNNSQNPD